jgi:EmrB/QacA subfamily drug resistance transporter
MDTTATAVAVDRRWWILLAVGVGSFMSALDGSVVNTILPLLRTELKTNVAAVEWVTAAYLLVVSALLLGVGRAGDLYGHKRSYVAGFVIFVAGSALCGLSTHVGALVGFRAIQAVGASMLFANSPAILTTSFPPTQRGRALGAQGTMTYLGLTVGPSFGGWLAGRFGWQSVFYINVPIGLIAIALAMRAIETDRPEAGRVERFDYGGAALFTAGLVALLIALNQGHAWGWGGGRTIALLVAAACLLAAFVSVERRRPYPMLDLTLFRSRIFGAATTAALINYVCVAGTLFALPFLLIQGRGLDTQQTGLILTAQPLTMAVVAPLSGALSDRIGSRLLGTAGMLLLASGLLLLAALAEGGSTGAIAGALAVVGLGVGLFVSPNNSALMGAAPRHRQGIAAGVLATARNLGMAMGVGLAGAVLTTVLARGGGTPQALLHGVQASLAVSAVAAVVGGVTAFVR